ncbi:MULTISPECIES: PLP-dependent aminotransferase family protein [Microbacterium]|uniref:MocR-like pyridoxine biosynthesis transcription factor PdxR n=1 Tax=Microbacterium TaxID=33882 RepID=UPI0027856B70|nr:MULTISPECIES: PLP-dependent aminotransferase family protein [Microbacterium]MDQ1084991.1 GntR family transcriptional regulator/MocR family aminotransferase [Microbacterium sp. SORGH_AS_0344]MDQ1169734.1 GntR family transcriptional regulator/MocR family aminotransferase [Microbacterium proteolyticum]
MIDVGILDRGAAAPLHEQLAHGIRAAVLAGRVRSGDIVPSTRALAADLGLARGTVVTAYDILIGEGYLVARSGGGTIVAEMARPAAAAPAAAPSSQLGSGAPVVDLRPGRPGTAGMVDAAWKSAWRRASALDIAADTSSVTGDPSLREAIAAHLGRTRGLDVAPDDVIVTAGTSDALLLTMLALTPRGPRLRVGIENPGYPRVRRLLARLGAEGVPIPVRLGSGFDLDAVEAHDDLDALIVTPQHHYPLGSRWDAATRSRLLDWAARSQTVVVEDDYDSEFPHGRVPLPPLHLLDPVNVVSIGTLSKVLSPSLRCGWIVATGALRARIVDARTDLDPPVSQVQQQALALYLAEGALARHTARRRRDYRHRRRLLLEAFAEVDGVTLTGTDGGLHAVMLLAHASPEDEAAVVDALADRGIMVSPLSGYAVPGTAVDLPAGIVLGYAEPSTPMLMDAVAQIIGVVRALSDSDPASRASAAA